MSGHESISVHPEEIKAQAPKFATESGNLADALHKLQSSLDGLGACWGADQQGQRFGAAYAPQRDKVVNFINTLTEGLSSVHEGLSMHADNHAGTELHNAENLNKIR
jgi:uncharacterized protein YukE